MDVKHKAKVFEKEDFETFLMDPQITTPYWLVRKSVAITAYYGGLRRKECEELLWKISLGMPMEFTSQSRGLKPGIV